MGLVDGCSREVMKLLADQSKFATFPPKSEINDKFVDGCD
jgi:hypothetical protein